LVDADYYCSTYPAVCAGDTDPVEHFCSIGWRERKNPSPYFDTDWYLRVYSSSMTNPNPLLDYIESGETRRPSPLFDPEWYAGTYRDGTVGGALAEYLKCQGRNEWRSPNDLFDVEFYRRENTDVRDAGVDPVLHYLHYGHQEGRNPSARFWTDYYRRKHLAHDLDVNPLVHHLEVGRDAGLSTEPAEDAAGRLHAEVRHWVAPGPAFEEVDRSIARDAKARVKAVAFYLPQFHAFPENDEWWGTGFTEWRNLGRGLPRYAGHYQPRVPRDLGFYDLTDQRTMRRQIELALDAGLHGFGFYYYWFNGKRLLHQPLDHFLNDRTLDINFCVIWANENWTRRWDGREQEILMRQDYNPEMDAALVDDLQRYFADPRYIRVNGRPLFVIYRMDIIPGGAAAIERWRGLWRERHGEDPLIFVAQTFSTVDPAAFAADGAVEFPPHKLTARARALNHELEMLDPAFSGWVFDYVEVVAESLTEPHPDYPLIKTAVPSWDNDARRQGAGTVLHGSTPELYEEWMRNLVANAEEHPVFGESFVFINAWNEWAEAAYLEPDVHYGAAYLNATARAICGPSESDRQRRKVLLVGHDAHPFGAQMILWHIGDTLRNQFGCQVAFLLTGGGELVKAYEELGRTTVATDPDSWAEVIRGLGEDGFTVALVNSVGSGHLARPLKESGFEVVSLVHELPRVMDEYNLGESLALMVNYSDYVVVPADAVKEGVQRVVVGGDTAKIVVRPQGVYRPITRSAEARSRVREELRIPDDHRIVLNLGSGDLRKGIDTFIQTANLARRDHEDLHFVWVGRPHPDVMRWLELDLNDDLRSNLHFVDFTDNIEPYYAAADVYFLTSREDPFPSVVLEALSAGLPVVAFAGSGGTEDLVRQHGDVVDRMDPEATISALVDRAYEADPASVEARKRTIAEDFRYDEYCFSLLQLLDPEVQKVSVVVPNYNYRNHLAGRLDSIFRQSYPVFEILVLDDASDDGSLEELERIRARTGRRFDVIVNDANSGSVFRQWQWAAAEARGEYLWIAEADDSCRPRFLERLVPQVHESDADIGFADSSTIDEHGQPLGESYKDYYREAAGDLLEHDRVLDGTEFVRQCLLERNLMLNVSAVVWRREALERAIGDSLDELRNYRLTGDWFLYAEVALGSRSVVYLAEPLNVHRRHSGGVTASLQANRHVGEIRRVHEALSGRMQVTAEERRRMSDYEEKVAEQLGHVNGTAGAGRWR
jgi:glycosyltransferase involved in cell wall biosynthesis